MTSPPEMFAVEGLTPYQWSNGPGYRYGEHTHPYEKVLLCEAGSIIFHTPDGDIHLSVGERMDLPAETVHSATVGPEGVTCWEAPKEAASSE